MWISFIVNTSCPSKVVLSPFSTAKRNAAAMYCRRDQHNVFRAADVTSFYKQQYEQMVFREFSLPALKHLRWVTNGSFV